MQTQQTSALGNGIKLVGEVLVPGAAEMLEGRVASGLGHNLVAGAAALVLAPISPLLAGLAVFGVKLNSYSRAVVGQNLWNTVSSAMRSDDGGSDTTTSSTQARPSRSTGPAT
jgi:hypothetical protein